MVRTRHAVTFVTGVFSHSLLFLLYYICWFTLGVRISISSHPSHSTLVQKPWCVLCVCVVSLSSLPHSSLFSSSPPPSRNSHWFRRRLLCSGMDRLLFRCVCLTLAHTLVPPYARLLFLPSFSLSSGSFLLCSARAHRALVAGYNLIDLSRRCVCVCFFVILSSGL